MKKPTAEHIWAFKKRMEDKYSRQSALDDRMLAYALLENEVDVAGEKKRDVKGFRSGVLGILSKRDSALLTVTPPIHVNPPTEDKEDVDFANDTLEPWLAGAWRFSQRGPVWDRCPRMLNILGRAWLKTYHWENLWSEDNEEFKGLTDDLKKADTPEKVAAANKAIKAFKVDEFPIRLRFVDPRNTWTEFDGPDLLPEVVEVRKMTPSQIAAQNWDLPKDFDENGRQEIEVVEFANHQWCAVVMGPEPELVYSFEHKMGKSPYTLIEADLMPVNDDGIRWCGTYFYATGMADTLDEILSDLRENHRDNTRTTKVVKHDPNQEQPENTGGRPTPIELKAGGQAELWTTESIELAPVPEINPQSIELLHFTMNMLQMTQLRPTEQGESKSGDSQNKFVTQLQVAERGFDPYMRAINEGAWDICVSFLRCVRAMGETVYVFPGHKGKGVVGLDPKKSRGWEPAIQCRGKRAIPIDESLDVALAQGKLQIGISKETVYEEMGYENPAKEIKKAREYTLSDTVFQQVIVPKTVAMASADVNSATPEQLGQVQEMASAAPPELLGVLQGAGVSVGPMTGPQLQGMANVRRTGVPQQPQQPEAPIGVPVG